MATAPPLFTRIPPALFGPLAGGHATLYWTILARLYHHEFEREPFFLIKTVVVQTVEELVSESAVWAERREELLRLRERLVQSGKPAWQLSRRALEQAVRRLARHSLVAIERGFAGEDDEMFVVSPLVEKVLPADRIAEIADRVRAYVGAAEAAASAGGNGSADGDEVVAGDDVAAADEADAESGEEHG